MKRAIVIILVVILVAGGGAGGLIMLGIVPNPMVAKLPEMPLTAADKAAMEVSQKNKFKAPESAYVLVKISDMVLPVIINGQAQRRVLLIARIMAASASDKGFIEANMRRFQDAALNDLVLYFQTFFLSNDLLDAAVIKARLVQHVRTVFGDHAKDVLLVNVFDQSNGRTQ